ncbi:DUF938 domain-containing protein [Psychrobacter jeotgali]|uniref:DUF938 domain-containing protein n=1 Tax=Psychrobacter jeotgali TaxID=179010 RepID=UPI00191B1BAA|nr:DUF938 domain-containing protein [Psychrobacter jeotgali]
MKNQNITNEIKISHQKKRAFQPGKLSPPRNFSIPAALDSTKPLVLEIGAGKGMHALSFAAAHPNQQLVAIERTRNKFEAFVKLAQQRKLANLVPVHADAIAWTVHALSPNNVARIYILYPNPEQNNPNQQWLNMPFFEFLLSRLEEGGQIILATNIESYMDNAEHKAITGWQLPTSRIQVPQDSQRTHFEVKYLARNEICWQLTITKPKGYSTRFDDWKAKSIEHTQL